MVEKGGIVAIKKYLEKDGDRIPMSEVKEFWSSCSDEDKKTMGENAAAILNAQNKGS